MATNGDESFFARYIEKAPAPIEPPPQATPPAIREMLDWLQHHWTKPTIRARDIYRYGPHRRTRGREGAIEIAENLVKRGWLIPLKAKRRDVKRWQITIGNV
jgi:hypothetical protein